MLFVVFVVKVILLLPIKKCEQRKNQKIMSSKRKLNRRNTALFIHQYNFIIIINGGARRGGRGGIRLVSAFLGLPS